MIYRFLAKPLLFLFSPENAHYIAMNLLKFVLKFPGLRRLFVTIESQNSSAIVGNITFPNKVGLAAGFDKNGKWINELNKLGFGHIEIGTVTPLPQSGNEKPRLFRLPQDHALINRMGFNNLGVDEVIKNLKKKEKGIIVGGNIGKNKLTPNENAQDDYLICFEKLFPYVDYFVVNVSSPNTPDLRKLQDKEPLKLILSNLNNHQLQAKEPKDIYLKIAPDLSQNQLNEIIEVVIQSKIRGIIATNTTIGRENLTTPNTRVAAIGNGGLSGAPLFEKSLKTIQLLRTALPKDFAIIGVGGIDSPDKAKKMIEAGADLIQVYSGFIYEGPGLISKIKKVLKLV